MSVPATRVQQVGQVEEAEVVQPQPRERELGEAREKLEREVLWEA